MVECGVENGYSASLLAQQVGHRHVWLFDSFEGLPEPGPADGEIAAYGWRKKQGHWCVGSEDVARAQFADIGWPEDMLHIVKGWFADTIPSAIAEIGPIALLSVDADWYAATLFCLATLYPSVAPGGIVAVDDHGHWPGATQAADRFAAYAGLLGQGEEVWYVVKPHVD